MLTGKEIKTLNLIEDGEDNNYRQISYDIRAGKIINTDGKAINEFTLEPQGIVEVISKEKINLPPDIAGYAMVKTGLCNEGILPLNIGIIDPSYQGYLSATLLNFGNKTFMLTEDEVFLRITFHRCENYDRNSPEKKLSILSQEAYVKDRKKKVMNFSNTFLNVDKYIDKATRSLFWKAVGGVAVAAVVLSFFAFLVTIGINFTNRNVWSKADLKGEIKEELRGEASQKNINNYEERIKILELQIEKMTSNQTSQEKK
jgi:deoxycytidine triphosphate deaminase